MNFFSKKGRFRDRITSYYLKIHRLPPPKLLLFFEGDKRWIEVRDGVKNITVFKQRLTLNSGMRAASSNITIFKTQLKRNSVWRPRQKFYFFQTANKAEIRCGDGEKLLLFYQTQKATRRFYAEWFLLFFKQAKRQKIDFFKAENQKFSNPKKVRKNLTLSDVPILRACLNPTLRGLWNRCGLGGGL